MVRIYSIPEFKICNKCKCEKQINNFGKKKKSKDGYDTICKLCIKNYDKNRYNPLKAKIQNKNYRKLNADKEYVRKKEYNQKNKEKVNKYAEKYRLNNKDKLAYRYLLINTIRRFGKTKEAHTIELLGYSALEFKTHIQNLFTEGMSWENYGKWHIDHKQSVSSFDKNTPMNVVNALSNLQPLWATTREINGITYMGNLNKNKY
jgi:hypothetical protein